MNYQCENEAATRELGRKVGASVKGGEVIELVGDVGAGKTTFTKGVAAGLSVEETVQSPTFTISRLYDSPRGLRLCHYDFYRLNDAGIMKLELQETANDAATVTVIEWGDVVAGVLPADRLTIRFQSDGETARTLELMAGGTTSQRLLESLR